MIDKQSNTEMGVVSDLYRISLIYSAYNFLIRTFIYINTQKGVIITFIDLSRLLFSP